MKTILILLLALPITASAPPTPLAVAKFCGNQVVLLRHVRAARMQAQAEGCSEIQVVEVDERHFLVYGVKVLFGE